MSSPTSAAVLDNKGFRISGMLDALRRQHVPTVAVNAAILALAYYIGARIGFLFQSPLVPQSVLWLPNSILLAALLMVPPRRWPVMLLAVLPAQLLVARAFNAPLGTMSLLYLTNCTDAVLGASAVRLVTRGRWQLAGLRNFLVFLGFGAVLGPLLVSFLDAAITVLSGWSSSFWTAYTTRLLANSLTNAILVPAIVGTLAAGYLPKRRTPAFIAESTLLVVSLLVVSSFVFSGRIDEGFGTWIYLPLPFLLWAAVRLGPGVTGFALLAVAVVSSWMALHGSGMFSNADPAVSIVRLQSLLLSIAVPMLSLAMVGGEREAAALELMQSRNAIRVGIDTVRDLAGRLITNQEEERARIARELHDGIGQYVAEIAISMSAIRRSPAAKAAGLDAEFQRLYDQTSMLFESVRTLSHELHPSILRHAGLEPAMRSLCDSFGKQHSIATEFEAAELDPLADDTALCIYRVTQEALHNIASHASARSVRVALARNSSGVALSIADDGAGFDVVAAHARRGLGLVSMEERARLVQGHLQIESGAYGTRISLAIPLENRA